MRVRPAVLLLMLLSTDLCAQAAPMREVTRGTLISKADPAASFVFDTAFQYAGGQTIDIMKVAAAEQHFFIDAADDHSIRRFYWVQFEHYYPDNAHTYDFSRIVQRPVQLGRLAFMGDVRTKPNYFTMDDRPGSDSKAAADFLRAHGYNLAGTFVTLRLFHLPDATKRRELMVIYGELLIPGTSEAQAASAITAHVHAGITVP